MTLCFPSYRRTRLSGLPGSARLCVGIFAFVSGYGMYHVMDRQTRGRFFGRLLAEYRCALVRILKLYGKLWTVLLIYMGIVFGILGLPFDPSQLPET